MITHVTPVADVKIHLEHTCSKLDGKGEVTGEIICMCDCNPRIHQYEDGGVLVVHNSFDGRELFEWDNKVRKN